MVRDQRDRGEGGPPGVAVSNGLTARGKGGPPGGDETIGIAESRDRTRKAEQRHQTNVAEPTILVSFFLGCGNVAGNLAPKNVRILFLAVVLVPACCQSAP